MAHGVSCPLLSFLLQAPMAAEVFVAFASYDGTNENEISLRDGDEVQVIDSAGDDWWYGRHANGQEVRLSMHQTHNPDGPGSETSRRSLFPQID